MLFSCLLIALCVSLFAGVNPYLPQLWENPKVWFKGYLLRIAVGVVISTPILYFWVPGLVGPFFGLTPLIITLMVVNFAVSANCLNWATDRLNSARGGRKRVSCYDQQTDPGLIKALVGLCLFMAVVLLATGIYSTPLVHSSAMSQMVGTVETVTLEKGFEQIKPDHILQVPREQAEWRGSQVLGEGGTKIGSMYTPTSYTIQKVGNELVWIAPLDYLAFRHWTSGECPPGYIVVSAQDPRAEAHLRTSWGTDKQTQMRLKYTMEACFSENLERHLWTSGYWSYVPTDWTFEVDDDWRPWWVVTLTRPTMGYTGYKVCGALIVNPETGEISEYLGEDGLAKLPKWVDRIQPEGLTAQYLEWWGGYHQGFWNGVWWKESVVAPTIVPGSLLGDPYDNSQALNMVWGADGEPYWFTGMRSANNENKSLFSFVLVHTRTGKVREFRVSGTDEAGVMTAVNNKVSFRNQHAAYPVLYNLYGTTVWTVPLLGANHTYQGMAFVQMQNAEVVTGDSLTEALRALQDVLAGSQQIVPGVTAPVISATFVVTRLREVVTNGNSVFFFWGDSKDLSSKVFTASRETSVEVPLTQPGDEIEIRFLSTGSQTVPVREFDNRRLPIHGLEIYAQPRR